MKRKRVYVANVLWEAANEYLNSGRGEYPNHHDGSYPSCYAVSDAGADMEILDDEKLFRYLRLLGCDTNNYQFNDFTQGEERQGVRYIWLSLAERMARDERRYITVGDKR